MGIYQKHLHSLGASFCAISFVTNATYIFDFLRIPVLMVFETFSEIRPLVIVICTSMYVSGAILIKFELFGENFYALNDDD